MYPSKRQQNIKKESEIGAYLISSEKWKATRKKNTALGELLGKTTTKYNCSPMHTGPYKTGWVLRRQKN
jgi:hypothetical protein